MPANGSAGSTVLTLAKAWLTSASEIHIGRSPSPRIRLKISSIIIHPKRGQRLAGRYHSTACAVQNLHDAAGRRNDNEFHLHRLQNRDPFAGTDTLAGFDSDLPYAGAHRRSHGRAAGRKVELG